MKIGLLDFGNMALGSSSLKKIEELVEYVEASDKLGFSRFWLGEHHASQATLAWSNPEILLPLLLASTEQIKIGAAGILICVHEPYHVASNFKMLANLFPNRVDLGLAKGGAEIIHLINNSDLKETSEFLNDQSQVENLFFRKSLKLSEFLNDKINNFSANIIIPPLLGSIPDIWLLGTSYKSVNLAILMKSNFSRSIFHIKGNNPLDKENLLKFREDFYVLHKFYPRTNLAIAGFCSCSNNKIKNINHSLRNNNLVIDPRTCIVGEPNMVYDELNAISELYGYDELIFLNLGSQHEDKITCIELMANLFKLK